MTTLEEWGKMSQNAKHRALREGTMPQPLSPINDTDDVDALIARAKSNDPYMMNGLSWLISYDKPDMFHGAFRMSCWGQLAASDRSRSKEYGKARGLIIEVGKIGEGPAEDWYKFVSTSGLWPGLPEVTKRVSDTRFVIKNLNWPSRLLINYMIALRIPARNPTAIKNWGNFRDLGSTPLGAFIASTFMYPTYNKVSRTVSSFAKAVEKYEHALSGARVVHNKVNLARLVRGEPLLNNEFMFASEHSGIPNNLIWETKGKAPHFLEENEVNAWDKVVSFKDVWSVSEGKDIVRRLEARLAELRKV